VTLEQFRDRLGEVGEDVDPAVVAAVLGVAATLALFSAAPESNSFGDNAILAVFFGVLIYMVARGAATDHTPRVEPDSATRRVEGEVLQVLEGDDLAEFQLEANLERRARATGEAVVMVMTDAPDTAVLRWLSLRFPVRGLLALVRWLTGGRVTVNESETVLLEEPPAEGDRVSLSVREATVEVPLDAVAPAEEVTDS